MKKISIAAHYYIKIQILLTKFYDAHSFHLKENFSSDANAILNAFSILKKIFDVCRIVNKSDVIFSIKVFGFIEAISFHISIGKRYHSFNAKKLNLHQNIQKKI